MRTRLPLALLTALGLAGTFAIAPVASAAAPVQLLTGDAPETSAFPSDRFTVPDSAQLTGRRVALPVPTCTAETRSTCEAVRLLNTLDGFDLQSRVFLRSAATSMSPRTPPRPSTWRAAGRGSACSS